MARRACEWPTRPGGRAGDRSLPRPAARAPDAARGSLSRLALRDASRHGHRPAPRAGFALRRPDRPDRSRVRAAVRGRAPGGECERAARAALGPGEGGGELLRGPQGRLQDQAGVGIRLRLFPPTACRLGRRARQRDRRLLPEPSARVHGPGHGLLPDHPVPVPPGRRRRSTREGASARAGRPRPDPEGRGFRCGGQGGLGRPRERRARRRDPAGHEGAS